MENIIIKPMSGVHQKYFWKRPSFLCSLSITGSSNYLTTIYSQRSSQWHLIIWKFTLTSIVLIESQNHKITKNSRVWNGPLEILQSNSPAKTGSLQYCTGWNNSRGDHNLSGQPYPALCRPQNKNNLFSTFPSIFISSVHFLSVNYSEIHGIILAFIFFKLLIKSDKRS